MKGFSSRAFSSALLAVGVLLAVTFTAQACGAAKHPATASLSIEGQTAVYARQVIAAVRSASSGVDDLIQIKVLPQAEGVKILTALREFGPQTQKLASVLRLIDDAKDAAARNTGILQAAEIVKAMQRSVTLAIVPVSAETNRTKVAMVLAVISDALADLSITLRQKEAMFQDLYAPRTAWQGRPKQGILATLAVPWVGVFRPTFGAW